MRFEFKETAQQKEEDGDKEKEKEKLKIGDVVAEVERHCRALGRKEDLGG